jgi:hypothetical protein
MERINLSGFLEKAEELAVNWKGFITNLNNLSNSNVRGEKLYVELFESSGVYHTAEIGREGKEEWERVFSSALCDSIRFASAIQLLSHYYTVLPDEENT